MSAYSNYRGLYKKSVKFRDSEKNFKQVAGAEKIFYGLDDIKDNDEVIIVEVEFDKLSFDIYNSPKIFKISTFFKFSS